MLWSDDYRIGVESVDEQHREIFDRLDRLMTASADPEVRGMAAFMANYVVEHFADEERLMRQVRYPGYESHRQTHIEFRRVVISKVAAIHAADNLDALKIELYVLVSEWLIDHILGKDRKITSYIDAQALGS